MKKPTETAKSASLFLLSTPKLIDQKTIEYSVPSSLNKVELERVCAFLPCCAKH